MFAQRCISGFLLLFLATAVEGQACLGTPNQGQTVSVAAVAGLSDTGPRQIGFETGTSITSRAAARARYGRTAIDNMALVRHSIRVDVSYAFDVSGPLRRVCPTIGFDVDQNTYTAGSATAVDDYWAPWSLPIGLGFAFAGHETAIGLLRPFLVPRVFLRQDLFERSEPPDPNEPGSAGSTDVGIELGVGLRRADLFGVLSVRASEDTGFPTLFLKLGWGR